MPETVTLSAPITKPSRSTIQLQRLIIDVETKLVHITWVGNDGEVGVANYSTPAPAAHPAQPTGQQLITTLNTANLTTNSLVKRVLTRLQTDGYITAGTIAGTPE